MRFLTAAATDAGTVKRTNQDSLLIRHALWNDGEVLLAAVCDGVGGLARGELASAAVVRGFLRWFENRLPDELIHPDIKRIGREWELLLKELNYRIGKYGAERGVSLGTTFTGILFIGNDYVCAHVGDTRLYKIDSEIHQLTTDHTFTAREIRRGNMTPYQAETDRRRNLLLQCVGASAEVEPEILYGTAEKTVYMICSDGLRHVLGGEEIKEALENERLADRNMMERISHEMVRKVKQRGEKDNISVLVIKAL